MRLQTSPHLQDVVVLDALRNGDLLERGEDLAEVLVGDVVQLGAMVCSALSVVEAGQAVQRVRSSRTY